MEMSGPVAGVALHSGALDPATGTGRNADTPAALLRGWSVRGFARTLEAGWNQASQKFMASEKLILPSRM